jgi:hypothetical protein
MTSGRHKKGPDRERGDPKFKDRNMRIKKMRNAGFSLMEIAAEFNMTYQRIQQILAMEERNERNGWR